MHLPHYEARGTYFPRANKWANYSRGGATAWPKTANENFPDLLTAWNKDLQRQ
jgi:hypothetical protein